MMILASSPRRARCAGRRSLRTVRRRYGGKKQHQALDFAGDDLVSGRRNNFTVRELVPHRDHAMGDETDETIRSDCCGATCLASDKRTRFRPAGHCPDGGAGWWRD